LPGPLIGTISLSVIGAGAPDAAIISFAFAGL